MDYERKKRKLDLKLVYLTLKLKETRKKIRHYRSKKHKYEKDDSSSSDESSDNSSSSSSESVININALKRKRDNQNKQEDDKQDELDRQYKRPRYDEPQDISPKKQDPSSVFAQFKFPTTNQDNLFELTRSKKEVERLKKRKIETYAAYNKQLDGLMDIGKQIGQKDYGQVDSEGQTENNCQNNSFNFGSNQIINNENKQPMYFTGLDSVFGSKQQENKKQDIQNPLIGSASISPFTSTLFNNNPFQTKQEGEYQKKEQEEESQKKKEEEELQKRKEQELLQKKKEQEEQEKKKEQEEQEKKKKDEEQKIKIELEKKMKEEQERRLLEEQELKIREEEQLRREEQEKEKKRLEEEQTKIKLKEEEERKRKEEEEEQKKKLEEEQRIKQEEERKKKLEEEERRKKLEEEERRKKLEEEEKERKRKEEEIRIKQDEEKKKKEEEQRIKEEEDKRKKEEEEKTKIPPNIIPLTDNKEKDLSQSSITSTFSSSIPPLGLSSFPLSTFPSSFSPSSSLSTSFQLTPNTFNIFPFQTNTSASSALQAPQQQIEYKNPFQSGMINKPNSANPPFGKNQQSSHSNMENPFANNKFLPSSISTSSQLIQNTVTSLSTNSFSSSNTSPFSSLSTNSFATNSSPFAPINSSTITSLGNQFTSQPFGVSGSTQLQTIDKDAQIKAALAIETTSVGQSELNDPNYNPFSKGSGGGSTASGFVFGASTH